MKITFVTLLSLTLCLNLFADPSFDQSLKVRLPDGTGTVIGKIVVVEPNTDEGLQVAVKVAAYRGIPYAQAPVGDLRWRAPVKLTRLPQEPFSALAFGPGCPHQLNTGQRKARSAEQGAGVESGDFPARESEDCLSLNVWTPAMTDAERLPVMVWIHGGGFVRGSAAHPQMDGTRLAARGVVVVSMNYRLGPLGFFHHAAFSDEPDPKVNFGLLDQIAALRWVKANIGGFGGDAHRVTIFGSSAGGASVLCLMLAPQIRGESLFHRAIVQSGGGIGERFSAYGDWATNPRSAQALAQRFYASLDKSVLCANPTGQAKYEGLTLAQVESRDGIATALRHGISFDQLIGFFGTKWDEQNRVIKAEYRNYPFLDGQVVAHRNAVAGFQRGDQVDVPLMIGYSSDEASLLYGLGQTPSRTWIERLLADRGLMPEFSYNSLRRLYGDLDDVELASAVYRDLVFGFPAQILAGLHQSGKKNSVWFYRFGYASPCSQSSTPDRAGHSAEVAYLFGTMPRPPSGNSDGSTRGFGSDLVLSRQLAIYWVNLAANGDPNEAYHWPPASGVSGASTVWPKYDETRRNVFLIDNGGVQGGIRFHSEDGLNDARVSLLDRIRENH